MLLFDSIRFDSIRELLKHHIVIMSSYIVIMSSFLCVENISKQIHVEANFLGKEGCMHVCMYGCMHACMDMMDTMDMMDAAKQ